MESHYSIVEGSDMLSSTIILQFSYNQSPFTVRLTPVTVDTAEAQGLGHFINSATITTGSRATLGHYNLYDYTVGECMFVFHSL